MVGLGNADALASASHGAGRARSRFSMAWGGAARVGTPGPHLWKTPRMSTPSRTRRRLLVAGGLATATFAGSYSEEEQLSRFLDAE